jgi:hypothetical protein
MRFFRTSDFFLISSRWFQQILLSSTLFASFTQAQPAPHLSGRIEAEPASGLLRGSLCLSNLPQQPTMSFLLNRGLNIRELKDTASGKTIKLGGYYNATNVGDATRYTVDGSVGSSGFCVDYVGAFPVYRIDHGEGSETDWKGQIAFDGQTVRAAEQTRFYPVIVDTTTGAPLDSVSYRLEVSCSNCKSIYINGAAPQSGPNATFSSEIPRPLLIYAGDFPYTSIGGIHFVGSEISPADADAIRSGIKATADAHAAYLKLPYLDEPVYLTFAAVARNAQMGRTSWAFVTWPTIAMAGRISFSTLLKEINGQRIFSPTLFMAHEMAHHYFGTRYFARGPLQWFLLESTAEFMALKTLRALAGEADYVSNIQSHLKTAMAEGEVIPLDAVKSAEQIDERYRYHLGPLLLLTLEQYTNETVVQQTLAGLIARPPAKEVRYTDFRERLVEAGATEASLQAFESECLHSSVASGCLSRLPALKEGKL